MQGFSFRQFLDLDVLVIIILALSIWGGRFFGLNAKMIRYMQMGALGILVFETLREIRASIINANTVR
jgi:hypothetical protein